MKARAVAEVAAAVLLLAGLITMARAEAPPSDNWLTVVRADGATASADAPKADPAKEGAVPVPAAAAMEEKDAPAGFKKPIPLRFAIDYTLISDYVFRGINLSEYPGEGREKPNHQLNVNVEADLGPFGTVGTTFWFEWFAGQENLTPTYGHDIQQINYVVYYRYTFEQIGLTPETGWIAYTFPPLSGQAHTNYEWYLKLGYNDAKLFGTKKPVLNPYIAYYQSLKRVEYASWWEAGISHAFAMADLGMAKCPVMKDITVTPLAVIGVQHRYFSGLGLGDEGPDTSFNNVLMGLEIGYDLTAALNVPEQYGKVTVSGLLYYSQGIDQDLVSDELFGGLKVGYKW